MAGTFGYELDPAKLTAAEKEEIRRQTAAFKRLYGLIQWGDYYRLTGPDPSHYAAWQFVSSNRRQSLVCVVFLRVLCNQPGPLLKLPGLLETARYRVCIPGQAEEVHTGQALRYAGLRLPRLQGDYPAVMIELNAL